MAKIIQVDGTEKDVNKEKLTLEYMQEVVGGYIEIVTFPDRTMLICNEEGRLKGLPINKRASEIWYIQFGTPEPICGNIIYAQKGEIK